MTALPTNSDVEGVDSVTLVQRGAAESLGPAWTDDQAAAHSDRGDFWFDLLDDLRPQSVIEVGCGIGSNLRWLAERLPADRIVGVDSNPKYLRDLEERVPGVRATHAPAEQLPFADRAADLVFTCSALARQPQRSLVKVITELVRVAGRHLLVIEPCADESAPALDDPRGAVCIGRDYGAIFEDMFEFDVACIADGEVRDRVVWEADRWWLFQRT